MTREVLISVPRPGEYWVAVLQDGRPDQVYVEQDDSTLNNIYKGRIVTIEPSIQAVFVDYGVGRNGFLHVSDVEPAYYRHLDYPTGPGQRKPLIQDIFRRSQEVLVQVIKEGVEKKGATLSTHLSIAGRYLVLFPGLDRVGVPRNSINDEERRHLWEIFQQVKRPAGLGFIVRQAGIDRSADELQDDLNRLVRVWQVVVWRIRARRSPAEVYRDYRVIRKLLCDTCSEGVDTVVVDELIAFEHARRFLTGFPPAPDARAVFYEGQEPLFHKYGIHDESLQRPPAPLGAPLSGAKPHRAD